MSVLIELQNTIDSEKFPDQNSHHLWIKTALNIAKEQVSELNIIEPELTIRLVTSDESQQLNRDYREKDKPTNVLSFPFEAPAMIPVDELPNYLGDLVICESVLCEEANAQNKTYQDHYIHLIIHGLLHLLGFDHIDEDEAEIMENLEVIILKKLGVSNPYESVN